MTNEDKKKMREKIEAEGWHRFGLIDDEPCILDWEEEHYILYQDMDGRPCECKAVYTSRGTQRHFFKATTGAAKGNHMSDVFAYKKVE